jgi:hypothetical protein
MMSVAVSFGADGPREHCAKDGLPSRSSFMDRKGSASASRRYGAASFACIHERRMVDQNSARWNRLVVWLRQLDALETTLRRLRPAASV